MGIFEALERLNESRTSPAVLKKACEFHDYTWPNENQSIIYFDGIMILKDEFEAHKETTQGV